MGKETELLKAVKHNDQAKIQKLLMPEKDLRLSSVRSGSIPSTPTTPTTPVGRYRMQLSHININCHEEHTGYTPLIIAVLNGSKDIAETLIFYAADVNAPDSKGNTALHIAVFGGHLDVINMLLKNSGKVDIQNSDGNTPLHIACQCEYEQKIHIILKLLELGTSVAIQNKNGATCLDVAATYNKKDAVSLLLDHSHNLRTNTLSIIEASVRGYSGVVELLLDYGVDPNGLDPTKETGPLHEAVRFLRLDVAEVLLKYGAKSSLQNSKNESPESLARDLPSSVCEKFTALMEVYRCAGAVTPRLIHPCQATSTTVLKDYPLLPTVPDWTENSLKFCNSCMADHPNTNLLDGNLCTFWVIPEAHDAWSVLDLKHEHTITGITVFGWNSPEMVKSFLLQRGDTIEGPWSTVISCCCRLIGSTDPKKPGTPQNFKDFTASSRYWRFYIQDNFGGKCMCLQGIGLYGADNRILNMLEQQSLSQHTEHFIKQGYNTFQKFLLIKENYLKEIIDDATRMSSLQAAIEKERKTVYPLRRLKWLIPPVSSVTEDEDIPEFSVQADPGTREEVEVKVEDAEVNGCTKLCLQPDTETEPSIAVFTGLKVKTCGRHRLWVQSVNMPGIVLEAPQEIEIVPKTKLSDEVASAFEDMESMLQDLQASLEPKG